MTRPAIGTTVRLITDSWYLRAYHHAGPGSIGEVTAWSRLGYDDDGVLIDWGHGGAVRSNADEYIVITDSDVAETLDPSAELERLRNLQKLYPALREDEKQTLLDDALLLAGRLLKAGS